MFLGNSSMQLLAWIKKFANMRFYYSATENCQNNLSRYAEGAYRNRVSSTRISAEIPQDFLLKLLKLPLLESLPGFLTRFLPYFSQYFSLDSFLNSFWRFWISSGIFSKIQSILPKIPRWESSRIPEFLLLSPRVFHGDPVISSRCFLGIARRVPCGISLRIYSGVTGVSFMIFFRYHGISPRVSLGISLK